MELKEFVEKALVDIVDGVNNANKVHNRFSLSSGFHAEKGHGQEVEFDVSVAVNESSESGEKSGILVALANIGAGLSKEEKQSESAKNLHRLKFKIFITEN